MRVYEMGYVEAGRYGALIEFGVKYAGIDGIRAGVILEDGREPDVSNTWFAAAGTGRVPPQRSRYEPGVSQGVRINGENAIGNSHSDTGPTSERSFYIYLEDSEPIRITTCVYSAFSETKGAACADMLTR